MSEIVNKYKFGLNVIKKEIKSIPLSPGIYKMIDENGEVLYVGKAKNLKKRVSSYSKLNNQSQRILNMISLVRKVELSITNSEAEALLLESNVIKANKPKFNILLKDDKSFPSILLTSNHDFPQIKKHRGRKSQKGYYFGPFSSAGSVNRSLDALQKGFLLRNCTDNVFKLTTKPCLQYQIKRCTAPCVGLVSRKDYQIQVDQAKNFLNGDSDKIKEIFAEKMQEYSSNLDFENAAVWRNKIRALTSIQSFQSVNINEIGNVDIIAVYRKLNKTSINISFMRNGSNFGDHNFFLSHPLEIKIDEIILKFLSQFYENKIPPKEIIVSHEPLLNGVPFEEWISFYKHDFLILNVKEEGLEKYLMDILKKHEIKDFFFLDQSFPFLLKTIKSGEKRCAIRISEFESIDSAYNLAGMIEWVWIDYFNKFPLNQNDFIVLKKLKSQYKIGFFIDSFIDFKPAKWITESICSLFLLAYKKTFSISS